MRQRGFAPILILIILAITGAVAYYFLFFRSTSNNKACTLEAKICPDGSSVGRSGPNCEFAECSSITPKTFPTTDPTANWKTYKNAEYNYSISYPPDWKPLTISLVDTNELIEAETNTEKINIWQIAADGSQVGKAVGISIISLDGDFSSMLSDCQNKSETTFGNRQAIKCEKVKSNESVVSYFFKLSDKQYLSLYTSYETGGAVKETLEQIISTFKFTE